MSNLVDALGEFSADELAALLTERPDLTVPPPDDLAEVARRAVAGSSVRRALDLLDRPGLAVAEAAAALVEPHAEAIAELVGFDPGPALDRLHALGLVWGAPVLEHALADAFGPHPGGLAEGTPGPLSRGEIEAGLVGLPTAARGVLEKLKWGPPTGSVRHADRVITEPTTPIEHLLARGLLRPLDEETVVLPREVALHLRGGFLRKSVAEPPRPRPGPRSSRVIDSAAVGSAFEFVHELEGLLDALTVRRPAPLRSGGLASRDLLAVARAVGAPAERAGFALEVAYAAGLLVVVGPAIIPSAAFDQWLELPPAHRWMRIEQAWLAMTRWPGEESRPLVPSTGAGWAPVARREILGQLAPGDAVEAAALAAWAAWHRPSLENTVDLTGAVLLESEWLGLTALGQASTLIVALDGELPAETAALFPDAVDHVLLQSDLTAVATGPLDRRTATALTLLADVESRGGGGMYRFTAASVRRAFDAGWSGEDIEGWLAAHSRTGLPQPLRYLIGDLARQHGTVRVGAARSYVRIDDPARLQTVLAHPAAEGLGLRQVGPEALVADADPAEVVALLRNVGLTPAAENAAGEMLASPAPRRPPAPARTRRTLPDPVALATRLFARQSQQRRAARTAEAVAVLERGVRESRVVEVEYVGSDGLRAIGALVPVEVAAGMVRFEGDLSGSLPLARVIAARFPESSGS